MISAKRDADLQQPKRGGEIIDVGAARHIIIDQIVLSTGACYIMMVVVGMNCLEINADGAASSYVAYLLVHNLAILSCSSRF